MISQIDYNMILGILDGNLKEGIQESPAPAPAAKKRDALPSERPTLAWLSEEGPDEPKSNKKVYTTIKFSFAMDKFLLQLHSCEEDQV